MFLGEEKGKRVNVARVEELVATGRAGDRHGVPVLPDDVPRRAGGGDADAAEAAGYRADCGGVAAGEARSDNRGARCYTEFVARRRVAPCLTSIPLAGA